MNRDARGGNRWGMDRPRLAVPLLALALGLAACVADDGRDALDGPDDRATPGVDVADYLLLDCDGPSLANEVHGQIKYTIPMGTDGDRGRFVIMKSSDGAGFEEWAFDDEWFYIRLDTTWAYENPANPGEWCDTQCGENGPGNCKQRWAGDAGDWVYTVYHEPGRYEEPARWLPRRLDLDFGQSTSFTTTMGIQAERYAGCGPCDTNFSSPSVDRSVQATRLAHWQGFEDVIELRVLAGPGAGERYYYGRGRGWIGFNDWVAEPAPVQGTATPSLACGGFAQGPVCELDDGDAAPPPPPPPGGSGLPDVRVRDLWWTPADPRPGDAVRFHAEVVNDGDVATPQVVGVGFAIDGMGQSGFWSVGEPLPAGQARTLTM
ncbi:MAG: hypothetical protein KDK70_33710, partial [Myxococcales bacterium]|nr:hypothetical protein [Myxococcales bacterium]